MLDNPWNAPLRHQPDDPGVHIIPLHRGAQLPSGTATGGDSPWSVAELVTLAERRLRDDRPDLIEALRERHRHRTLGERLVAFFRDASAGIGWSLYVLGVGVAMFFAFQVGRAM